MVPIKQNFAVTEEVAGAIAHQPGRAIICEKPDCGVINVAYNDGGSKQVPYRPQRGYYNELLNLYNALTGKEAISVTPEMEYGDVKTVLDILRSIRENRVVDVDEVERYIPAYVAG